MGLLRGITRKIRDPKDLDTKIRERKESRPIVRHVATGMHCLCWDNHETVHCAAQGQMSQGGCEFFWIRGKKRICKKRIF